MRAAIFLAGTLALTAQESTIHTVDGLNRPLPDVKLTVFCDTGNRQLTSDTNGKVRGTFDRKSCTSAHVEKPRYTAYSTGLRDRYVLTHQLTAADAESLINTGTPDSLRELLASESPKLNDAIFQSEHRLRPALRELLKDPQVTLAARSLLALIAHPEDIRLMLQLSAPPGIPVFPERWRYRIATALLHPTTDQEWNFLLRCARNDFSDWWLVRAAIQSLKLNPTARSKELLEEVGRKDPNIRRMAQQALAYIESKPPDIDASDLATAASRLAQVIGPKTWEENRPPRFNQNGDKALVDLCFHNGEDAFVYTATFHKSGETWVLRGVHESLQAFSPRFKAAPKKP